MPALLQKTLKVVPAPLIEVVPKAPPALEMAQSLRSNLNAATVVPS